jgi:hypothetical protein
MHKTMLTGALILTAGLAQETRNFDHNFEYRRVETVTGNPAAPVTAGMFFFGGTEMAMDGAVVKGAPYSADASTETSQTLADGNRIHRTSKSALYRDSEGRTRREQTLGEVGPLVASGGPIQTVVINDPVAGTTYMLNSRDKTAHKMPGKAQVMMMTGADMKAKAKIKAEHEHMIGGGVVSAGPGLPDVGVQSFAVRINGPAAEGDMKNIKAESLGTQMMEGVAVDGTRTTLTIPAGSIGNDRAIEVVTEQWYSKQLQTTVMTKTTDPRMGETVYKLSNIKLDEPAQSLFTVPSDYQVIDPMAK